MAPLNLTILTFGLPLSKLNGSHLLAYYMQLKRHGVTIFVAGKGIEMKEKIFWRLLSTFSPNVQFETYTNQRSNMIKNGGCSVFIKGRRVAYLYAIVDTCGAITEVLQKGIFASFFKEEMEHHLMDYMMLEEGKKEHPRDLYFNCIDTPLR